MVEVLVEDALIVGAPEAVIHRHHFVLDGQAWFAVPFRAPEDRVDGLHYVLYAVAAVVVVEQRPRFTRANAELVRFAEPVPLGVFSVLGTRLGGRGTGRL